ncbi:hypothetical protein RQP53_03060 [Paucibacter sp. APW11]|uniref:Uncharacterized protein n=1 Tax=Roseateles aquae TaxID=3077235 RepID=A0ABU3P6Q3_9BURK|nr:hypothetical protein [Paucibacter sp. APW11]MDT8998251.1 hypothetical protein [Paucibacter sp. APW11]
MQASIQRWITHPALALGSTVLWGVIECVALWRSRRRLTRSR